MGWRAISGFHSGGEAAATIGNPALRLLAASAATKRVTTREDRLAARIWRVYSGRLAGSIHAASALAQRLPHAVGGRHHAGADHELGAHEDQRARPAHDPAFGLDEFADLDGVDKMHVELHGRLRLARVGMPAGHAHRAVREGHQHAALDDAAAVVVLGLRREGIPKAFAGWPRPERADQADEALVAVGLPAGRRGVETRRLAGDS